MGYDDRIPTTEQLIEILEDNLERNEEGLDKLNLTSPVEHALRLEEIRKSTVKDYVRSLEAEARPFNDAIKIINSNYSEYAITKREHPPKWMENKKTERVYKTTEFKRFMKYLRKTSTLELTRSLQDYVKVCTREEVTGKGEKVTREIRLYAMDYPYAQKQLGLTKDTLQGYMAETVRIGLSVIVCKGCGGPSGRPTIYDIGSWNLEVAGRKLQIWHYKESKEWIDKIASFSPFKRCYK